jgi:mercuric ion transport protein
MNTEKFLGFGLAAGLAFVCCAGPLLLVAFGSVGLSAWFAAAGYVLIPIVLAGIGLMGIWLYRRNRSTSSSAADYCDADNNSRKLKS